MHHNYDSEQNEVYEDIEGMVSIRNLKRTQKSLSREGAHTSKTTAAPSIKLADDPAEMENTFEFTYHAGRHEKLWLTTSLVPFREQGWIEDVLRLIKGGKEATVYLCKGQTADGSNLMAAKIYRPRQFRNLKDDHLYQEGRTLLDGSGTQVIKDRDLRAVKKKTQFGWEVQHTSWIEYEYQSLRILHDAGADVPSPFSRGNNAILMQYFGNELTPAPTLNTVELTNSEARILFQRVIHNVELLLAHNRVHGDLSAFNILYWDKNITLIDFPQVIDPERNTNAYRIFERDLVRVSDYFQQFNIKADPHKIAHRLWADNNHKQNPLIDVLYLDEDNPADRKAWQQQQRSIAKGNKIS